MNLRATAEQRPIALAATGAACISSSAVLVQLAGTTATTTAFYRCALALPALFVVAAIEHRRLGGRPLRQHLKAALAGLAFSLDLVLWNHAIAAVGAGIATVLGNLQVLFVTATAWILFNERPSNRVLMAVPVVAVGVILVAGVIGGSPFGHHPAAGIAYGVGTSLAYAAFLIMMRSITAQSPHVAGPLADATAGAAVASALIGLAAGTIDFTPGRAALGWLLALALLAQVLGWLLITSSLPRLPSSISSLMLLLQPAAALGLAAVILSQRPTAVQLLGALLVCAGVLFAVWKTPEPAQLGEARPAVIPADSGPERAET